MLFRLEAFRPERMISMGIWRMCVTVIVVVMRMAVAVIVVVMVMNLLQGTRLRMAVQRGPRQAVLLAERLVPA